MAQGEIHTSSAWDRHEAYDLSLVLTWFNENALFHASMARIMRCLRDAHISCEWILVDDASDDATRESIEVFMTEHPHLAICSIFHARNLGRGAAVRNGLRQARSPYCGFLDVDLEVGPEHIPTSLRLLSSGSDMVLGERHYSPPLRSVLRFATTWVYRVLVQMMLGTPKLDTEAGFKFFRTATLRPVLERTQEDRWFWDTEITVIAHDTGLNITPIPVMFTRRNDKVSAVHIGRDTVRALRALVAFRKRRRFCDQ